MIYARPQAPSVIIIIIDLSLHEKILADSIQQGIPGGTMIRGGGQRVTYKPFVLKGVLRVFTLYEAKVLLLLYVPTTENCITSFAACLSREPSSRYAQTVEVSEVFFASFRLSE